MSNELLKQLKRSRISTVEVNGYTFKIRRPTDEEAQELGELVRQSKSPIVKIAKEYTIGWENVKARDIVPQTKSDDPVEFEPELWREWCADRPDFWGPIANTVMEKYQTHSDAMEEKRKKSESG